MRSAGSASLAADGVIELREIDPLGRWDDGGIRLVHAAGSLTQTEEGSG